MRRSRVIKHARQVRTTHLRRTVNTSSRWRFWLSVQADDPSVDRSLPWKKWRIMQTSARDRQSLHCFY